MIRLRFDTYRVTFRRTSPDRWFYGYPTESHTFSCSGSKQDVEEHWRETIGQPVEFINVELVARGNEVSVLSRDVHGMHYKLTHGEPQKISMWELNYEMRPGDPGYCTTCLNRPSRKSYSVAAANAEEAIKCADKLAKGRKLVGLRNTGLDFYV